MRSDKNRKTYDFDGMKYSPELIRQYENPEYAKEADRYEREARRRKRAQERKDTGAYTEADIFESEERSRSSRNKKNRKKKKYRWNKLALLRNLLILLVLLVGAGAGLVYGLAGNFDRVDTEKSAFAIDPQVKDDLSGYRNIAILGVDARADEGYDGSRTDAVIIMSIKKSNGDIRLISVMRDSYVKMEDYDGNLILDKMTHAHHYLGGANTCAALNRSLDLNIEEYVIFNWKAVADVVDCLGGIEVYVKENEVGDLNIWGPETAENVGREYKPITSTGRQTLDGVQATTYCRIRKNSGGDSGRSERYKKVMAAVMKKALKNPGKINELSETVFPNVRTNMSRGDMVTVGLRAPFFDFQSNVSWPKEYYPGLLSDGISYVVPLTLESNVKELHEKAFGQENYQVSETCKQISDEIIYDTGLQ